MVIGSIPRGGSIPHGGPIELFLVSMTGITKVVVCVILSEGLCT